MTGFAVVKWLHRILRKNEIPKYKNQNWIKFTFEEAVNLTVWYPINYPFTFLPIVERHQIITVLSCTYPISH